MYTFSKEYYDTLQFWQMFYFAHFTLLLFTMMSVVTTIWLSAIRPTPNNGVVVCRRFAASAWMGLSLLALGISVGQYGWSRIIEGLDTIRVDASVWDWITIFGFYLHVASPGLIILCLLMARRPERNVVQSH